MTKSVQEQSTVVHIYQPGPWVAEAGGSNIGAQGWTGVAQWKDPEFSLKYCPLPKRYMVFDNL